MGCALTGQVPQMPKALYYQLSHAQGTLQHLYILMDVAKTGSVVVMLASRHNRAPLGTLAIAIAVRYCERAACMDTTICRYFMPNSRDLKSCLQTNEG